MKRSKKQWQPLQKATVVRKTPAEIEALVRGLRRDHPQYSEETIRERIEMAYGEMRETWKNDRYTVTKIDWPALNINGRECPVIQLSIRRNDRAAPRDWRDFQRIKNELVGPECEGIELYPAASRVVDTANQFHVWCVADPEFRFPFGYTHGAQSSGSYGGAVQRPI